MGKATRFESLPPSWAILKNAYTSMVLAPAFLPTLDTMPKFPRLSGSAKVGVLFHLLSQRFWIEPSVLKRILGRADKMGPEAM
jgi:hypothetical protein